MERLVRFAGCRLVVLLVVCLVVTAVASARSARVGECTPASSAPKLDGKLDDECWKSAAVMTDFLLDSGRGIAADATIVRACFDKDNLYLGIECIESNMAGIKASQTKHDGPIDSDDDIELFLDTVGDGRAYYQFMFNTLGTKGELLTGGQDWDCDWTVAVDKQKDRWTAEVAIPLKVLGETKEGSSWGFNVGRGQAGKGDYSSFAGITGKWSAPEQFGTLKFVAKATGQGRLFAERAGYKVWVLHPQQALNLVTLPDPSREYTRAFATGGEYAPFTFHVLNIESAKTLAAKASVTDFAGPDGAKLPVPASAWLYLYPKLAGGYESELLGEGDSIELPPGQRGGFWLDFKVPADAKAGFYKATVTLDLAGKKETRELSLLVLPFTLDANPTSCGFHTPKEQNAALLVESMTLMREHGMTTFAPYGGWGGVAGLKTYVDLRKQYGFDGKTVYADTCMYVGDTLARELKLPKQGPESLQKGRCFVANDAFRSRYVAEMKKYYDEAVRLGAPEMSFSIGDELTNDGYYAALHSIERAKILREGLPKMVLTTDTNGYTEALGTSKYLNCVGVNDGWDGPDNHNNGVRILTPSVMKQIRDNGCGIEFVNTGTDRFPFGLYLWRMTKWGVQSKIEWIWWSERLQPGWLNVYREHLSGGKPTGKAIDPYKPPTEWKTFVTVGLKLSRMGTYDTRYMATLENALRAKGDPQAQAFLDDLLQQIPISISEARRSEWVSSRCDVARWLAAKHIMAIKGASVGTGKAAPIGDEAMMLEAASRWSTADLARNYVRHKTRTFTSVPAGAEPKLDGTLDDAVWKDARVITGAYRDSDLSLVDGMMTVRAVHTDKGLYLGIANVEPAPEKISFSTKGDDDPNLWQVDDIEVFVAPKEGGDFYHLVFDVKGARCGYRKTDVVKGLDWKVASQLKDKLWTSEVFLPFATFGGKDRPWRIFVGRGSPTRGEYYGIMPIQGSWLDVSQFGTLDFAAEGPAKTHLQDIGIGLLKVGTNSTALRIAMPGKGEFKGTLSISAADGSSTQMDVEAYGEANPETKKMGWMVPFEVKSAGLQELTLTLKDKDGKVCDTQVLMAQVPDAMVMSLDGGSKMTFARTVSGSLAINLPKAEMTGCSLEFELASASPQVKLQAKPLKVDKIDGNRLDFSLKLPSLPEGKYTLSARLKKGSDAAAQRQVVFILADPPAKE